MALSETENRWASRVWQARLLRLLIFLAPVGVGVAAAILAGQFLPHTDTTIGVILWWASLVGIATSTLLLVDRLARRALPLAILMQMTMLFPDKAPNRVKMVRRAGSVKRMEERLDAAKAAGEDDVAGNAENVLALAGALSAHDRLTRGHAERVRVYVDLIAEELDLDDDDRDRLRWASLLHDIGKLDVHREILNKDGRPTEAEWEELRRHPTFGAALIGPLAPWLGDWSLAVEQHHEKYDGTGYPHGLAGEGISYAARIVAVADAYDAITSARSYKAPISAHTARQELARSAGTHFDPVIVRAFMSISLGKIRWVIGPASWFAQIPFIGGLERIGRDLSILGVAMLTVFGAFRGGFIDVPEAAGPVAVTTAVEQAPGSGSGDGETGSGEPGSAPIATTSTSIATTSTTSTSTTSTTSVSTTATSPATTTTQVPPTTTSAPRITTTTVAALRAPTAGNDLATTAEDMAVTVPVLDNDSDPDGDALVVAGYDVRTAFGGDVVCGQTSCTYNPALNFNGTDSFSYVVSDEKGGLDRGKVTVTVTPVNDAPVARADNASTTAGSAVVIFVLTNDSDPEGQQRSIVAFDVSSAQGGTVSCDVACVYSPPTAFSGIDTFSYTMADPAGLTATATVTITVN